MKVVLISTYELGHQPFGLASPAAWLKSRGHTVHAADLALDAFPSSVVRDADFVAFYLPMHTATRLAARFIARTRFLNPSARIAAYGLYAPLNEEYLRSLGVETILGGEFESALADWADRGSTPKDDGNDTLIPLDRLQFIPPDRSGLPALDRYARLIVGENQLTAGYTEASRGCKHVCRHCPVTPVYKGTFRVVQADVVLEDIRRQVAAGAQHITFGDPDFFNGPAHALRIVEALHRDFPPVGYDVTIKVEHLLKQGAALPILKTTGCRFVTSAVESLDDAVLSRLDKGHTRADFLEAVRLCQDLGLPLNPTFIAFTPWTTRESYLEFLHAIRELGLVDHTGSVQLALRLLIPSGSRLLELEEIRALAPAYNPDSLVWAWRHPDPAMDELAHEAVKLVAREQGKGSSRRRVFAELWQLAGGAPLPEDFDLLPRSAVPYLNEPWYC